MALLRPACQSHSFCESEHWVNTTGANAPFRLAFSAALRQLELHCCSFTAVYVHAVSASPWWLHGASQICSLECASLNRIVTHVACT